MITLPQAQYIAYQFTRKLPADSVEKFSETLLDAKPRIDQKKYIKDMAYEIAMIGRMGMIPTRKINTT